MSSSLNTTAVRRRRKSMAVYKRYSDDNLQAAMRLVVEGGAKTADASVKFGIPFTTLSRKLRIYKESMGFCGSSSSSTSGLIKSPANKKFKKEEEEIVVEPPVQVRKKSFHSLNSCQFMSFVIFIYLGGGGGGGGGRN